MKNSIILRLLNKQFEHLKYNHKDYTMSIVADESNKLPVFFIVFDSVYHHCKFELIKSGNVYGINFISDVSFTIVQDIFNIKNSLESELIKLIRDINNRFLFLNYFLFNNYKLNSENNYEQNSFVYDPSTLYSKELKPFISEQHIGVYTRFYFLMNDDYELDISYRFLVNAGKDLYTSTSQKEIIERLLTDFICIPLNLNLSNLTFNDYLVLQMTKV